MIGPAFHNTDLSLIKDARAGRALGLQFRADVFDLFNHPNFGPPGNIVGSPTFGKITQDAPADRRGRLVAPDSAGREAVVLK